MLNDRYPYYLGNEPVTSNLDLEVTDKFNGEVATIRLLVVRVLSHE